MERERYFIDGLEVLRDYYPIYDRRRPEVLAVCTDPEIAQRIVNLLNADAAAVERQGLGSHERHEGSL